MYYRLQFWCSYIMDIKLPENIVVKILWCNMVQFKLLMLEFFLSACVQKLKFLQYQSIKCRIRGSSHKCIDLFNMLFLCKHMLELCMTVALLFHVYCSVAFLGNRVKLKEFQLLHTVMLINVSIKTVDQSEDPEGRVSITSFCLQLATVLFDGSMAEEAFCAALFLKPFLSTASRSFRRKDVWSKLMIKMYDEKLFELWYFCFDS